MTTSTFVGEQQARGRGSGGHSVLLVPVPELEPFVRGRWDHYEPALVSTDPAFTHAHVTVLSPYLPDPSDTDLEVITKIADSTAPFEFTLAEVDAYPDGIIRADPVPAAPFAALTAAMWAAFPQCPPYGGEYGDVAPHVTLDRLGHGVSVASTRSALGSVLPARCHADAIEWHWYETGNCHVVRRWELSRPVR